MEIKVKKRLKHKNNLSKKIEIEGDLWRNIITKNKTKSNDTTVCNDLYLYILMFAFF